MLGLGSLTERLCSAHFSSQSSFTNKKSPRGSSFSCLTECFQSTEQKTRATGFSCIVINKAGVNTFVLVNLPLFIPCPQLSIIHSSYTTTGDLLCHHPTGQVSTGGGRRLSTCFPFLGITWALHWGQLHWQSTTKEGPRCGQHVWHHCTLPTMTCSTWQHHKLHKVK